MENSWSKENRLIIKIRFDKILNFIFVNKFIDLILDISFIIKELMWENIFFILKLWVIS